MRVRWPILFACAATAAAIAMWGFTVDDALISIRYARHLASGAGYRFNLDGPSTDGVTPLPWPFLLAPLAHAGAMSVLVRAKVVGVAFSAVAVALASARAGESTLAGRITGLLALGACLPMAAYAASGMETPVATLLVASCVFCMDRRAAAIFAGLAAAVRPELLPWAATVSCGLALARRDKPAGVLGAALVSAAPFVVCAVVRRVAFGHFAPLAVSAKPSDVSHGALYAAAALVATAMPVLLLAPRALLALPRAYKALAVAFGVHVLAVIAAGGDSMPYARLFVPVLPTVLAIHLQIARVSRGPVFWLRSLAAIGLAAYVAIAAGPRGRRVMRERADLVARAEPILRDQKRIAAVDVGWVSALGEQHVVDLAGLTDPEIAALPGGHTSKRVSGSMLLDRDVDAIVLYADPLPDGWAHFVGYRLANDPLVREHYERRASIPLGDGGAGYAVLVRSR